VKRFSLGLVHLRHLKNLKDTRNISLSERLVRVN